MQARHVLAAVVLVCGATLSASDYLTEGADPARTGWVKDENVFTLANVKDMKLLWKIKLDSQPRQMHNLFPPLIAERVTTARGPREIAIVAGVSDDLFGIDVATGEVVWKKHYESTFTPAEGAVDHTLCLGGQTADARDGTGRAGHIHGLRDWMGRPASPGQRGRWGERRPAGEVHAAQRQAVRAQRGRRRRLYGHARRAAAA